MLTIVHAQAVPLFLQSTILKSGSRSSPMPTYLSYFPEALSLLTFAQ